MGTPIIVVQNGIRILVDPEDRDRIPKPVITYKLTPEEMEERYGHINASGKRPVIRIQHMREECEDMKKIIEKAQDKYDRHEELCKGLNDTYRKKNIAYGDAFSRTFRKYGLISALTRMSDKWNRIEALVLGAENEVEDESLQDTLKDLACYCLMTIIEIEAGEDGGIAHYIGQLKGEKQDV